MGLFSSEEKTLGAGDMKELKKTLLATLDNLEDELEESLSEIQSKVDERDAVNQEIEDLRRDADRTRTEISRVEKSIAIVSGKQVRNGK